MKLYQHHEIYRRQVNKIKAVAVVLMIIAAGTVILTVTVIIGAVKWFDKQKIVYGRSINTINSINGRTVTDSCSHIRRILEITYAK